MEEITKEKLSDRSINIVSVLIGTEKGCDYSEGEYSMYISGLIGNLNLMASGGNDDVSLIKDCIENNMDEFNLPEDGTTEVILIESGEWEGYSWLKYYEVHRVVNHEH